MKHTLIVAVNRIINKSETIKCLALNAVINFVKTIAVWLAWDNTVFYYRTTAQPKYRLKSEDLVSCVNFFPLRYHILLPRTNAARWPAWRNKDGEITSIEPLMTLVTVCLSALVASQVSASQNAPLVNIGSSGARSHFAIPLWKAITATLSNKNLAV